MTRPTSGPRRLPPTAELAELLQRHRPGHALAREFYTDPRIFERDLDHMLLRHWFCAGHASTVPAAGDYLTIDLGAESVIVVRTAGGEINALVNVCRHRGSRICTSAAGKAPAGRLTCPYHAWSYDLDGRLVAARQMGEGFAREEVALRRLPLRVSHGLVFVCFAAEPPDFAPAEEALGRTAGLHGWARAKVAHRELYSIRANWKLAVENYMECYHCQPAHPEFAKLHVYARPAEVAAPFEAAGRSRAAALGIAVADVDEYGLGARPGAESVAVLRSALHDGAATAAAGGRAVAPLMGAFRAHDGNSTYFDIGPISDFLAYADHGVIYRFIPREALRTEMEVLWLVDENAVAGRDYDLDRLTWLWKTTSAEDKRIVELNQAGVSSRFFEPGPYSLQEAYANRFVEWYRHELAASDGLIGDPAPSGPVTAVNIERPPERGTGSHR